MDALTERDLTERLTVKRATGFAVVTCRRDKFGPRVPPFKYVYSYNHCDTLEQAQEVQAEYERGQYEGEEYVGTFAVRHGMPFGPALVTSPYARLAAERAVQS